MVPYTLENYKKQILDNLCRWIEVGDGGDMVCLADKVSKNSYCPEHMKAAYRPISDEKRKRLNAAIQKKAD